MPPRLLYIVTEDWFFVSHFLPTARTALALGFDVAVATRVHAHAEIIRREGLRLIPMQLDRAEFSALGLRHQVSVLSRMIRAENPALVHAIALRSLVLGGLAARRANVPALVLAPTGLGHLWTDTGLRAGLRRTVMKAVIRRLRGPGHAFLFENKDDPGDLGLSSAAGDRIVIVPGAGVDPAAFDPQPDPGGTAIRLAFVGRMLRPKGIDTAVTAVRLLRSRGLGVTLDLWGIPDPANPESLTEQELRTWSREPGISWHGRTEEVAAVWASSHIALVPTRYREGLPKALVEAMAAGRPVITTNVTGCRDAVRNEIEGLLVPPNDPGALADAIACLAADRELRERLGAAARRRVESDLSEAVVTERVAALYRDLVPAVRRIAPPP